jgi:hypothetical protein
MYVVKFFLPVHLSAIYPYPNIEGEDLGARFYVAFAAVALAIPAVVLAGRRTPAVLFGLAFFFINIVLVLQLVSIGQAVMADRYTYLPYIGLVFALFLVARRAAERDPGRSPGEKPSSSGCLLLLVPVSLVQTYRRCDVWQDPETLWNDTIEKLSVAGRGRLLQTARPSPSSAEGRRTLWPTSTRRSRSIHASRGCGSREGTCWARWAGSTRPWRVFERALELQPSYPEVLINRAAVKLQRNDLAGSIADCTAAIALNGGLRDAYSNRALGT